MIRILPLLFLLTITSLLQGQTIEITDLSDKVNLGKQTRFIEDKSGLLTVDAVASSEAWTICTRDVPNFLVSSSSYWLELKFQNSTDQKDFIFEVMHPGLDRVEFYKKVGNSFEEHVLTDTSTISSRPIKNQYYGFNLSLIKGEVTTIYLKVQNGDPILVPMRIGIPESIVSAHNRKDLWFGLFSGILLAMFLANFFIYLRTKEKSYFIYGLYIVVVYLTQANFQGYTLRWFLEYFPIAERYAVFVLSAAVGISAMFFMYNFLDISRRQLHVKIFTGVYLISVILAFAQYFQISFMLIEVNAAALATTMLVTSYRSWKSGNKQALNFLRAWVIFLTGVCIFVMKDFALLPYNSFTFNVMTIGAAIETVVLSFALADRINVLKLEKEESDAMRIANIENQNEILEVKVHERTAELEEAKNYIQSQYDHLRVTQKQLVESEKLAGLGQMTAGIAHELNNPINFVSSNVGPLHRDIEDVVSLLMEYFNLPDEVSPDQMKAIREKCNNVGVTFIKKEIDQLLHGIEEGSRRTAEIVRGLRIFARADKDTLVSANVNECLQSTIVVMKSVTKGQVTLTRELDMNMPYIDCFPGKLNQVIANLITNAVQATKDIGTTAADRHIQVTSHHDDNFIHISVKDNGVGIDEALKEKIFMPFFTTKGVGEGTGLGLSIAMGIVEEHKGEIEVITEKGKGTEFIIHLPRHREGARLSAA